ncbi:predicted protein [Chaetoceros tenuissimus]|uniref:F-box domain-containing protein n=1 Tax=Chaetoceros tenuissimus TaxID=426638 RepID=A0AAD3CSE3_9STRA|nr:predicted protein [Chaetoceros tenuissimus]
MDMMHSSRSNKRQRIECTPLSLSQLPANVLSNCFSFLGPSGHYYFLASVCKDFKVAVDELYGDDRNTSMDSILTSVSTFTHVIKLIFEENGDEYESLSMKITAAVFENDRVDLYQDVVSKMSIRTLQGELTDVSCAIRYKSTEIMRSIIENEQIIYLLKNLKPPEGIQIDVTPDDMPSIVQALPAACDPQMIHQLVKKGVVFKCSSVCHSLRRKELETFKCMLDMFEHEENDSKSQVIFPVLEHEMHLDAIKYLKQKGYFDDEIIFTWAIVLTNRNRLATRINVVKCILEGQRDISDRSLRTIIASCISYGCMDVLSYIHESVDRINIEHWLIFAESHNLTEVVAHLQSMR